MTDRYQSLFIAALIVLAAGILLALIRAIRGPRVADRIMGINMIGTMSTACIAILSVVVLVKNHIAAHREEDRDV